MPEYGFRGPYDDFVTKIEAPIPKGSPLVLDESSHWVRDILCVRLDLTSDICKKQYFFSFRFTILSFGDLPYFVSNKNALFLVLRTQNKS